MIIRSERCSDVGAITEVAIAAFRDLAVSQHAEQFIIKALRKAGSLAISLAAESTGRWWDTSLFRPWFFLTVLQAGMGSVLFLCGRNFKNRGSGMRLSFKDWPS